MSKSKLSPISEIMMKPALSIHELARVLDLSMPFMYRLRASGLGPQMFKIGRTQYCRIETLRAWLKQLEDEAKEKA